MVEIVFHPDNFVAYLPENWEEVSPEQYLFFIKIIHTTEDTELAKMLILKEWAKIPNKYFTGYNDLSVKKRIVKNGLMHDYIQLASQLNVFFESVAFGKNLLPIVQLEHQSLYGPADNLANVTANELDKAYYYLDMYTATEDMNFLKLFFVCLWRPHRTDSIDKGHPLYNGDIREPFNENNVEYQALELGNIDPYILFASRYIFNNNLRFLAEQPNWEKTFKSNKKTGENGISMTDWNKIFRSIASSKIGTLDEIKKISIIEVFDELEYLENERESIQNSQKL